MQDKYKEILFETIKPRFKAIGFKISGSSFSKKLDDLTVVFYVEKSQWNRANDISFWFRFGVFIDSFYEFMFNVKAPNPIKPNLTSIELRAGLLLKKENPNYNYHLKETNFDTLLFQIQEDLDNTIIPFLNSIKNIEDILSFEELDSFCDKAKLIVGFSLAEKGNKKKAELLVNQYLNSAKYPLDWINRILIESKRLNLNVIMPIIYN